MTFLVRLRGTDAIRVWVRIYLAKIVVLLRMQERALHTQIFG